MAATHEPRGERSARTTCRRGRRGRRRARSGRGQARAGGRGQAAVRAKRKVPSARTDFHAQAVEAGHQDACAGQAAHALATIHSQLAAAARTRQGGKPNRGCQCRPRARNARRPRGGTPPPRSCTRTPRGSQGAPVQVLVDSLGRVHRHRSRHGALARAAGGGVESLKVRFRAALAGHATPVPSARRQNARTRCEVTMAVQNDVQSAMMTTQRAYPRCGGIMESLHTRHDCETVRASSVRRSVRSQASCGLSMPRSAGSVAFSSARLSAVRR